MRKLTFVGLVLFFAFGQAQAQDPVFSQFFAAPLQLNPAFAGVSIAPRLMINYRNQWPSWPNAYRTYAVAYEQSLPNLNSGFGLSLMSDDAGNGIYRTSKLSLLYSYEVRTPSEFRIKFGLEAGVYRAQLDWSRLLFGDQFDPINGLGPNGQGSPSDDVRPDQLANNELDFSAGMLAYSEKFYGGFALHHLNNLEESYVETQQALRIGKPLRISVHGGAQINMGGQNGLPSFVSPNFMFVKQADFVELMLGSYAAYGPVFAGGWYKHSGKNPDAFVGLIGYRYGIFRLGYSYDATVSGLTLGRTGGSHEVSIALTLDDSWENRRKRKKVNINDCFQLFR
jgi:type IX secretion system PorP/SprF family membrane protein